MNFDELYLNVILNHHQNPRGATPLSKCNADSSVLNPTCGDDVTVRLLIADDKVEDIEVRGHGCAISTARDGGTQHDSAATDSRTKEA